YLRGLHFTGGGFQKSKAPDDRPDDCSYPRRPIFKNTSARATPASGRHAARQGPARSGLAQAPRRRTHQGNAPVLAVVSRAVEPPVQAPGGVESDQEN